MLVKSKKKFKDAFSNPAGDSERLLSDRNSPKIYKKKLVGAIPGAHEQAFGLDALMQEDVESEIKEELPSDRFAIISLSREDKVHARLFGDLLLL
nr:hypothetical protein CFP56_56220 [Quercus suber]